MFYSLRQQIANAKFRAGVTELHSMGKQALSFMHFGSQQKRTAPN